MTTVTIIKGDEAFTFGALDVRDWFSWDGSDGLYVKLDSTMIYDVANGEVISAQSVGVDTGVVLKRANSVEILADF